MAVSIKLNCSPKRRESEKLKFQWKNHTLPGTVVLTTTIGTISSGDNDRQLLKLQYQTLSSMFVENTLITTLNLTFVYG
jgi:hypothetical protein